jgi:uncharacterized UPF0160 family protein
VELKEEKVMWVIDMSCPSDANITEKEKEKKQNYADLAFELRLQRPEWKIIIVPLVVGVMGSTNKLEEELKKIFEDDGTAKRCRDQMQMTTVMGSCHIIHRVQCGLV